MFYLAKYVINPSMARPIFIMVKVQLVYDRRGSDSESLTPPMKGAHENFLVYIFFLFQRAIRRRIRGS